MRNFFQRVFHRKPETFVRGGGGGGRIFYRGSKFNVTGPLLCSVELVALLVKSVAMLVKSIAMLVKSKQQAICFLCSCISCCGP